jgi:acyl carrier protein
MCFEDEFGVTIGDDDAQDLRQVSEIVAYIESHV